MKDDFSYEKILLDTSFKNYQEKVEADILNSRLFAEKQNLKLQVKKWRRTAIASAIVALIPVIWLVLPTTKITLAINNKQALGSRLEVLGTKDLEPKTSSLKPKMLDFIE